MDIDKLMKKLEEEKQAEKWYETILFEVSYFFRNLKSNIRSFFNGMYNFWKFRSEIYNWRWWDYSFFHSTLKARLNDMAENWEHAHYIGSEQELETLRTLVQLLDKIEDIENNEYEDDYTYKSNNIDNLYQEFGELLFSIKTVKKVDDQTGHEYEVRCSNIRRLWD